MSQFAINPALDGAIPRDPATSRFQELGSEDFIKIIFTELSNQDPFQPNDSAALLDQLNSIRSIESDISLTKQLDNLVTQNQLASAGNLVGKFVGGLTDTADRVAGFVIGVSREGDSIQLELDNGWAMRFENVETILDPSVVGEGAGTPQQQ